MNESLKLMLVAGARPNFMKIAPLVRAIEKFNHSASSSKSSNSSNGFNSVLSPQSSVPPLSFNPINPINYVLVHTGQHYDVAMSEAFFRELELPEPDVNLEVGSSSHAVQTAEIMKRFEPVLMKEQPDIVIVVGDVNSTMACALVASKIQYPTCNLQLATCNSRNRPLIAHVEAGLRSFDRTMPEEINRLVTDSIADFLFTPSEDADENLLRQGIPKKKIKRVGNIMIDTLTLNLDKARAKNTWNRVGVRQKDYAFVTLHRPSNVDDRAVISNIIENLAFLSERLPVVFPVHPRTKKMLDAFGLLGQVEKIKQLRFMEPIGYHDTICLIDNSRFVLTDSGGIQEETTFLGIPCLTLRPNTERPITITQGTNRLTSVENLKVDFNRFLNGNTPRTRVPELWDGKTGERIIKILAG